MTLVDSHCHLDFPDFGPDRDEVIARARRAGVGTMVSICTHVSRFPALASIAESHSGVWCTVGIHPHHAAEEFPGLTLERLCALAGHPRVVGFGETGLDFHYRHSPPAVQEESFRLHLAAAAAAKLPVVVHTREADADICRILEAESRALGPLTGLIHCFSSSQAVAEAALALGFYISVSGIVTFRKTQALRDIIATVPLDRLLVETDAPFLAPDPHRGRRNEPAYVVHTAAAVARVKGVTPEELAQATTANFHRLFTRAQPSG